MKPQGTPKLLSIPEKKREALLEHLAAAAVVPLIGVGEGPQTDQGDDSLASVIGEVSALAIGAADGRDGAKSLGLARQLRELGPKVTLLVVGTRGFAVVTLDDETRKGKRRAASSGRPRPKALAASYEHVTSTSHMLSSTVRFRDGARIVLGNPEVSVAIWRAVHSLYPDRQLTDVPMLQGVGAEPAQARRAVLRGPVTWLGVIFTVAIWAKFGPGAGSIAAGVWAFLVWSTYRSMLTSESSPPAPVVPLGTMASVAAAEYLGGFGAPLTKGLSYELHFTSEGLVVQGSALESAITITGLRGLGLGGAGEFETGGGFVGGGFGVRGAMEGIALASVLNAVTMRTHREVIISVAAQGAELYFVNRTHTPQQLRIELSEVLAQLADGVQMHHPSAFIEPPKRTVGASAPGTPASPSPASRVRGGPSGQAPREKLVVDDAVQREPGRVLAASDLVVRLGELAQLHRNGVLTDQEFEFLKAKLLMGE